MTRTAPPQVAFSSGELDPLLHRRFDYQRYQTGLAQCRGFLPLPQGGFTRAPGTIHRGATRANALAGFIPFVFAANDAVVLEFTPLKMRVWRYGALVMAGADPYEITTPYDAAALQRLQWVQSADVVLICDGVLPVHRLARAALNSWTIAPQIYTSGPFRVQNLTESLTLQASAETGTITLTASAAVFDPAHVGALFMLTPTDYTTIPLWTSSTAVAVNALMRNGEHVYKLTVGTNTGANPPIHETGKQRVDGATEWEHISDNTGIVQIATVVSATSATATVIKRVPKSCVDDPTYRWSEGAWSTLRGYPATIEIVDQRLAAAATPSEPRAVWFSAAGDYNDFEPSVEPDGSFAYVIAGGDSQNRIQTLKRGRSGLHIFAMGEEYSARSETRAQVIGPTTARFGLDGSIGAAPLRAVAPDGNPIFITRDRRRVMMVAYSLEQDANRNINLSLPAQHLGAEGFAQIVWQSAPQRIGWIRRDSGDLAALVYEPSEEILGWAVHSLAGGFVEAMCVTPDATGTRDVLTLAVRRTVNGATVRFVEELALTYGGLTGTEPIAEAVHFFAASVFTPGSATSVFSLPHLPGATVHAWTNAGEFGPLTVANNGTVTLPSPVTRACIGLFDATHVAETLDIQAAIQDGNSMGRRKRLHAGIGIGLHRTAQGTVRAVEQELGQPPRLGHAYHLVARSVGSDLTTAWTGIAKVECPTGHATEISLRFQPWSGAPMTVTAVVPTIQESGR